MKICKECGKSFEPNDPKQKYCSKECAQEASRRVKREAYWLKKAAAAGHIEPKVCPVCGKNFYPKSRQSRYCSRACRNEAYAARARGKRKKERTLKQIPCERCGKMFTPSSWNAKYCSKQCQREAVKEKSRYERKPKQEKTCLWCGKTFLANGSYHKYCSPDCQIEATNYKSRESIVRGKTALTRPYTKDTRWLIRKWYGEGLSIREIGYILSRSEENVRMALEE